MGLSPRSRRRIEQISLHRTYVLDNVPAGPLREHALKSVEYTLDFFEAMLVHLDDELNMLLSLSAYPRGADLGTALKPS